MDKNSGSWFVVAAVGVFGVAAVLAYSWVAPTWDQGETSTLLAGLVGCPTIGVVIGGISRACTGPINASPHANQTNGSTWPGH